MISKSAVTSYRKYLTERIEKLKESHAVYKMAENENAISENHAMGLNSTAACLWDMKTIAEEALEIFDMEMQPASFSYKILNIAIGPYTTPKITFKILNEEVTFELQKIPGEQGEDTLSRLIAKADKYAEFEAEEKELQLLIDGEPVHPGDTLAIAFPETELTEEEMQERIRLINAPGTPSEVAYNNYAE